MSSDFFSKFRLFGIIENSQNLSLVRQESIFAMASRRKSWTKKEKLNVIDHYYTNNNVRQTAREMGVSYSLVWDWLQIEEKLRNETIKPDNKRMNKGKIPHSIMFEKEIANWVLKLQDKDKRKIIV